jgi:TPR repeat protein
VDDEHVLALVEAVHGAHFDAVHGFAANATLVDDVGQLTVLSAGRSGELVELQQVFPPRYTQVLANTEVQMRSTRSCSGQHVVEGVVHRGLLFRVERVHLAFPEARGAAIEAMKWFRKAADQGNPRAQHNLGFMYAYANGESVLNDLAEAVKWYRKAADQGYRDAQFNLATMYATARLCAGAHVAQLGWPISTYGPGMARWSASVTRSMWRYVSGQYPSGAATQHSSASRRYIRALGLSTPR